MLVSESRSQPRNIGSAHAGALLFGDWGTSRLYVLGLAFFYTAHASVYYLAAMGVIMAGVAWAYTVICRCFPDGGGTYAAARRINPTLSVIGATLLICDYIVTVALSTLESFKYFGLHDGPVLIGVSIVAILVLAAVNWYGARSSGRFALFIAIASIVSFVAIALIAWPLAIEGARTLSSPHPTVASPLNQWESLVRIMLALAGVEAVANMTGLMKQPVARTARRTIWPVLIEVALLNVFFGLALAGLPDPPLPGQSMGGQPDYVTYVRDAAEATPIPEEVVAYRDTGMKLIAIHAGQEAFGQSAGFVFGKASAIVFGLLLLSAANTAMMAMVAVLYAMASDRELPRALTKLNYSGVPWVGLVLATALCIVTLVIERDVARLAELYAIGVVGAISISLLSCVANRQIAIKRWERMGMLALGAFMLAVEITIAIAKFNATVFAGSIIVATLVSRWIYRGYLARREAQAVPEPAIGWIEELKRAPTQLDPARPRIMLAARGRYQAEFAVDLARRRHATLFVVFVRTLRVMDTAPGQVPRIEDDRIAQESLGTVAVLARDAGVPFFPIYVVSPTIAEEILDYTVTFGCDTLIMGKSRRSLFSRRLAGDVVASVAEHLPDDVALITRSADTPHVPTARSQGV